MALLEIRSLSVSFQTAAGPFKAVDGVDISLDQGEILGVVGESGSGKILVTGNAACSIAMRNAILGGVPKPLWRAAYLKANSVISGDVTTLAENREKAIKAFAAFGVKPEQIYAALDVAGSEDITVDHIGTLRGMHATLKNGEATVEEMFSPPVPENKGDPNYNPVADAAKAAQAGKGSDATQNKKSAETAKETSDSSKKSSTTDPEIIRSGASAARDGEERTPPEGLDKFQTKAWLDAYDAAYEQMEAESGASA